MTSLAMISFAQYIKPIVVDWSTQPALNFRKVVCFWCLSESVEKVPLYVGLRPNAGFSIKVS
jgi:hypothetical protein